MTDDSRSVLLKTIGTRILSEANDLKRTAPALASELGFDLAKVESVIAGNSDLSSAHEVLRAMAETYPISLADIWVEADDTDHGVRITTAAQSLASSRVFDRKDAAGGLTPYYEYRDTAMSRTAPFKPEWIKELRVVGDASPDNKDVAYNNGHLMHQTTFFVGPVNFYWEIGGQRHCAQMDTGDSNYVTPYVPHSFASRDPNNLGLILAVTYGGELRRALSDFSYLDADTLEDLAADPRKPDEAFVRLLANHTAAESLNEMQLLDRLTEAGFERQRARELVTSGGASDEEIRVIAEAMSLSPSDLTVSPMEHGREVVVTHRNGSQKRRYPDEETPAYEFTEMARTKHQPYLKGLDVAVLDGSIANMQHSLHQYTYNYGDTPVSMAWGDDESAVLMPGDSSYIRPMVRHRFEQVDGAGTGNLVVIRIPGGLSGQIMAEFSAFAPEGRRRVAGETTQWY